MVLVGGIMRSDLTIELPDTASIKCSERSDIIGNLLIKKKKQGSQILSEKSYQI